ncbi:MAG: parB-like partition protein [Gemmatimonadetes bacterium]|jgi:ParB family chromosome partitioning protein|nr:parB-like partition protein [Gemmatimonadota bacterium]
MSADTPRRLGRGLEALISTAKQQRDPATPAERSKADLQRLRIADIQPNPFQPRRTFTPEDLADLESSLRASGLIQPITVRARPAGGYELVAGERRLRAATRLGWSDIPALIRDFDDQAMLTLALVENLQRANLNPLEEAQGYQRLIDEFGLTQQQVADAIGKDRTTITNLLRVLTLPAAVLKMVERGHITAGHARALLVVKDPKQQVELANEIVARGLSVREVEARARGNPSPPGGSPPSTAPGKGPAQIISAAPDPATRRAEEQLRKRLQTDVSIQQLGNERGVVRISFYSHDDLDRVLEMVLGKRSDFD